MYIVKKYSMSYVREPDHVVTRAKRVIAHRKDVVDFCKQYLDDVPIEKFVTIALDNRNRVIGFTEAEGAEAECPVHPSNVFRFLLSTGARSFIVTHNHPAGGEIASEADWTITKRLKAIGELLNIPLNDHLIIGDSVVSLRESSRWEIPSIVNKL